MNYLNISEIWALTQELNLLLASAIVMKLLRVNFNYNCNLELINAAVYR